MCSYFIWKYIQSHSKTNKPKVDGRSNWRGISGVLNGGLSQCLFHRSLQFRNCFLLIPFTGTFLKSKRHIAVTVYVHTIKLIRFTNIQNERRCTAFQLFLEIPGRDFFYLCHFCDIIHEFFHLLVVIVRIKINRILDGHEVH